MPFDNAVWQCRLSMPFLNAVCQCRLSMPFVNTIVNAIWQRRLTSSFDNIVWQRRSTMSFDNVAWVWQRCLTTLFDVWQHRLTTLFDNAVWQQCLTPVADPYSFKIFQLLLLPEYLVFFISALTNLHVTWVVVYLALFFKGRHCNTIKAKVCPLVRRSINRVSVTSHWRSRGCKRLILHTHIDCIKNIMGLKSVEG